MKIEVGKYYRTKNGYKVRIYATDGGLGNKIHGAFQRSDGAWMPMWWAADGWCPNDILFSLIAEWTEPLDFDPSCLPAWAEWIAMNDNGVWVAVPYKPDIVIIDDTPCYWDRDGYSCAIPREYIPKNYTGDWKDSLHKVSDL